MQSRLNVSYGNSLIVPTVTEVRAVQEKRIADTETPLGGGTSKKPAKHHPSLLGATAGFFKAAVAATLIGAMATTAFAQDTGAPLPRAPIRGEITGTLDANTNVLTGTIELDHQYGKLDDLLSQGRITPSELANARRLLHAALIDHDPAVVLPRDVRGRIDVLTLARLGVSATAETRSRGELAFTNLTHDLETLMRVTARDMANPNTVFIEGAPGYKEIPADVVKDLVVEAMRTVPLGEIPGGAQLARLVRLLPNMADVDAEHLSSRELERIIPDRERAWFNSRFGSMVEGHEVEAGVIAFAAITGLRAGSPGAAHFIDGLGVRVRIVDTHTEDGRLYGKGWLVYRDQHIFPDLDVETGARHVIGNTTLRATVTGTVAPEADSARRVSGHVTLGARYDTERLWIDSAVSYFAPEDRTTATIRGGYFTESEWNITGGVTSTFGNKVAIGRAPGRVDVELDLTKDIKLNGASGDFGLFVGAGADTDGRNDDVRAGMIFRLRW